MTQSSQVMPLVERYAREAYADQRKKLPRLPERFEDLPYYLQQSFMRYGEAIFLAYEHFAIPHDFPTEPDILAAGYEKIETGAFKRKVE